MVRRYLFAVAVLAFGFAWTGQIQAEESKPVPDVVAVFDLHGALSEQKASDDPLFGSIGGDSLHSLVTRLKKAEADEKVAAVVLLVNGFSGSTAQFEELHQTLTKLREKKPVYAHADSVSTQTYALMTGAKRVSISPTGDAWVNGLAMEGVYVRGLLDMLGVQPDFLTCGTHKSAAEMFMLKEASPQALEMQNWLLDSLYSSLLTRISSGRGVEKDQVKTWIDDGLYNAESAQKAGLIDAVESREELLAFLKTTHGATIKLDKSYGKKTAADIDLENPFAMMQIWAKLLSGAKPSKSTKNAIAIMHIDGPIMLGKREASLFEDASGAYSEQVRKALDKIADEPRIRAVVLRVNSPGGSATASEIMLKAIQHVQKSKPVIVSMGGMAASGGYYVSARGNHIFADATTLTGSIGVVTGKLATSKMWSRVGVNFEQNKRGQRAGMLTSSLPWTESEKQDIQKWMDEIYGVFKNHVTEGREGKLKKPIDEIAGGRVYTGQQALELGLVDEIGTLEDAIAYAAKSVELTDYEIRSFPEQHNFFEQLLVDIGEQKKKDDKHLTTGLWSAVVPALQGLDPHRTAMVKEVIQQLEFLHTERVMLTSPVLRVVD